VRDVAIHNPDALFADAPLDRANSPCPVALSIGLGSGASVRQEVKLELGFPDVAEAELALPLAWHSVGRSRLLPMFNGSLKAIGSSSGTTLRLSGTYAVPLGFIGRVVDRVIGRRAVRHSLQVLVAQIGQRLDAGMQAPLHLGELSRPIENQHPRESEHPEIYIG
jgi:hypothetical protein